MGPPQKEVKSQMLKSISALVDRLLGSFLPPNVYDELTFLYNTTLIALAAGALFLVLAVVCVIVLVVRMRSGRYSA